MGGVVVPVAHVNALFIVGFFFLTEFRLGAQILAAHPGGGQLAAGIGCAQKDVCQYRAGLGTQLGQQQNVVHIPYNGAQVHRTAHVQHQQEYGIQLLQCQNVPLFAFAQQKVPGDNFSVAALAGNPGENVNCGAAPALQGNLVFRFRHDGPHALHQGGGVVFAGIGFDFLDESRVGLLPDGVVPVQPVSGENLESCLPEALLHGDGKAGVHFSGAGAALDRVPCAAAVQRDVAGPGQGKLAAALQKQGAFRSQRANLLQVAAFIIQQLFCHTKPSFVAFFLSPL